LFSISGAYHSGLLSLMMIISLVGANRLRLALGAQLKIGFIDGSCAKPDVSSDDLKKMASVRLHGAVLVVEFYSSNHC